MDELATKVHEVNQGIEVMEQVVVFSKVKTNRCRLTLAKDPENGETDFPQDYTTHFQRQRLNLIKDD